MRGQNEIADVIKNADDLFKRQVVQLESLWNY